LHLPFGFTTFIAWLVDAGMKGKPVAGIG